MISGAPVRSDPGMARAPRFGDDVPVMERAVPILPADDLGSARTFYSALGFRVMWEASEDGHRGLLGLERSGLQLTIDAPMPGHGRQACASLHVEDADRCYAEWRDKVDIPAPPRDESWGARTFSVLDPAGNTLFVIGPAGATSVAPRPAALVALAHVRSVPHSIAFYRTFGFDVANTHAPEGRTEPVWAWLQSERAQLMIAAADAPIDPSQQAILFYLYCSDVARFRDGLIIAGVPVGPIQYPFYSPGGEFRVSDPDGYVFMVAHT